MPVLPLDNNASEEEPVTKVSWTRPTVKETGGPVVTSAPVEEDNGPMDLATVPVPQPTENATPMDP